MKKFLNKQKDSFLVKTLLAGGVAVIPTDTIYGIVCSALRKKSVERLYEIKGRTDTKPFIILVSSFSDIAKFGISLSFAQKKSLLSVWPGKVSVVLPCSSKSKKYLTRGGDSLAFRMPKSLWIRSILEKTGPLVAPSANPQGFPPASTIREARGYFGDFVGCYKSSGRSLVSQPSTLAVLKENGTWKVLRSGAVPIKT